MGPDGVAGGLLRAAEIEAGHDVVSAWRSLDRPSDHGPKGEVISALPSQSRWRTTEQTCSTLLRGFGSNRGSRGIGQWTGGWGSVLLPRSCGASGFRTRERCPRSRRSRERGSFREDGMIESVTENILDELTWRGLIAQSTDLDAFVKIWMRPVTSYAAPTDRDRACTQVTWFRSSRSSVFSVPGPSDRSCRRRNKADR